MEVFTLVKPQQLGVIKLHVSIVAAKVGSVRKLGGVATDIIRESQLIGL